MLIIKEIFQKEVWEDFLLDCKEKTFLNSWNWGEFQKKMGFASGGKIWRFAIFEANRGPTSVALITKIKAKRGNFLLMQHGPNLINPKSKITNSNQITNSKSQILKILLGELKKIGKKENCSFIRIAPLCEKNEENEKIFKDLGFRKASMHANAYEDTWKLDLTPSEDDLLINMRKTTRYLIRQAEKNQDIAIEKSSNLNDVDLYQKLNNKVAKRQNFVPFSSEYIKNEFEVFSKDNQALLFFGRCKGEIAAAALIIFWSGIGFYHQAASDSKYAKFSIPYLLQWEAIKEAKRRGCILYDFWGYVSPKEHPNHPWAGPTLFKMGFGGKDYHYIKTQDYVLSSKYWLNYIIETIRKKKRRL